MCGRFALTSAPEAVRVLFGIADQPSFPPRENIAPSEPVGIIIAERGARRLMLVRWGFIPAWTKAGERPPLLFNARAETAFDKPAFRHAIRRRRCLVPADAWYEWRGEGEGRGARKTKFMVRRRDGAPFAFGGIWETYVSPDGGEIDTMAILTTDANGALAAIHPRMPLLITPEHFARWLDCTDESPPALREIAALMRPWERDDLEITGIARPAAQRARIETNGVAMNEQDSAPPQATRLKPEQGSLF
jgi:putative SOS response-associated peptidase YedK